PPPSTLFPYTTLFRSLLPQLIAELAIAALQLAAMRLPIIGHFLFQGLELFLVRLVTIRRHVCHEHRHVGRLDGTRKDAVEPTDIDRKSTRLNSSHVAI